METNKPFKLDEFWNDCLENSKISPIKSEEQSNFNKNKNIHDSNSLKANQKRIYRNNNNIPKNETNCLSSVNKIYQKLKKKYPKIFRNSKLNNLNNISHKKRIENALKKSQILYEEANHKKRLIEKNMEENSKNKLNKELSLCTFRPKISKRKRGDEYIEINPLYKKIYERDLTTLRRNKKVNRSVEVIKNNNFINDSEKENHIKQKLKDKSKEKSKEKLKSIKKKNEKESFFQAKENSEFILRYTKARDEKFIKKIKKLYKKDYSYDYYLKTLASRIGNNEYNNSLNVNNEIPLYGESISRNNIINPHIGKFVGLSFNDITPIKKRNKSKKIIINEIRKGLMEINDIDI